MNNSPQIIKISQLNPSIKGQYRIVFEVAQIVSRKSNDEDITCQIVDETGIITAYFNQYAKFVSKGSVYELVNLRCNVVDHHLRLEMIKQSELCKKPLKIGFKDMENDLSVKFYVEVKKKQQEQKVQAEKQKSKIETSEEANKKTDKSQVQEQKNIPKKTTVNKGQAKQPKQKVQKVQIFFQKTQKKVQKQSNTSIKQQKKNYIQKKSQSNVKQQNTKFYDRQEERQKKPKKIYKAKNSVQPEIRNVRLNQIHQFAQEQVNLFAKVLKNRIDNEKYYLCKVADSTGGIFIQFFPQTHLQVNQWYHFNNFMIYADKIYEYVAVQTKNSSIQLQQDYNDRAEYKFVYNNKT